jgi:hypothetical protein
MQQQTEIAIKQGLCFSPLRLYGTSDRAEVSVNATTNGNRWERGLGCEQDGLKFPN